MTVKAHIGIAGLLFALAPSGFAGTPDGLDVLDSDELSRLQAGEVITDVWHDKSRERGTIDAFAAVEISAAPQQVWAVMTSCEKTLEVVRDMKSCAVLETSPDGAWDIREQRFDAPFPLKDFRTLFRTDFTPFRQIAITEAGGDMKIQRGLWQITPLGDARVRVTYRATVQPKFPLPRFLLRRGVRKDTPDIMTALRDASERIK